ncbi:MAG: DKNYY domain-containing protein [Pseudobacteriovorax sp.]|nr:DKNYY domain-containing protein [Pseudobacteriovorax sp.]
MVYHGKAMEADANSFVYLGRLETIIDDWVSEENAYAKDANYVYQDDKVIEGVNPRTINSIEDLMEYLP